MIATTARLASLLLAASAPALAVSNSSIVYVGSNYTGPNVAHPNATWNGHSVCYNYFLQKDNCVHGSLDHPCKEDGDHDVEPTYTTSGETIMKMTAFSVRVRDFDLFSFFHAQVRYMPFIHRYRFCPNFWEQGVFDFTETIVSTSIDMPSLARRYDSTQKVRWDKFMNKLSLLTYNSELIISSFFFPTHWCLQGWIRCWRKWSAFDDHIFHSWQKKSDPFTPFLVPQRRAGFMTLPPNSVHVSGLVLSSTVVTLLMLVGLTRQFPISQSFLPLEFALSIFVLIWGFVCVAFRSAFNSTCGKKL